MTEHHYWLWIQDAPQHVQDAASVTVMEPGRSRVRIYHGPDDELYALWTGGERNTPANRWVRLPDVPLDVPLPATC